MAYGAAGSMFSRHPPRPLREVNRARRCVTLTAVLR
jgi:hypothetical protein